VSISLADLAAEVARNLASAEIIGGSAFISTPLLYPGGAPVVVRIDAAANAFFASDAGIGQREATIIGADRIFLGVGGDIAKRFGVEFDQSVFICRNVRRDELAPAVVAIANASRSAVELSAYRHAEKSAADARDLMREKLATVFGKSAVTSAYAMRGASNDEWKFDAAVTGDKGLSLFQVVTPAAQSVYGAVARFVDVSDLAERPRLVAVIQDRLKTPRLRLVERSALTIDLSAAPDRWRRAAA
jgi:hypothetical protein